MEERPIKMDEEELPERWEGNWDARESQRPRKERMPRKKMSPVIMATQFRNTGFERSCGTEQSGGHQ